MHSILEQLRFDPTKGDVIRVPPGRGYGYWVGGHKVSWDSESGRLWLFYRERTPLEKGRGGTAYVARSDDGVAFEDVWHVSKEELAANSIEAGHVVRNGDWRLYLSYEIAGTTTWRIDVISAERPEDFVAQARRTVLNPHDYGIQWIKDPVVVMRDSQTWLYAAAPPREADVRTGLVLEARPLDASVLAVSNDGLIFDEIEYVFEAPGDTSWHGRRARINCVFPWNGEWAATFDGGRSSYHNYEEMAGLAVGADGRSFTRIVGDEPWLSSPHGCVRYAFVIDCPLGTFVYYEYTRSDGSHDLRVYRLN